MLHFLLFGLIFMNSYASESQAPHYSIHLITPTKDPLNETHLKQAIKFSIVTPASHGSITVWHRESEPVSTQLQTKLNELTQKNGRRRAPIQLRPIDSLPIPNPYTQLMNTNKNLEHLISLYGSQDADNTTSRDQFRVMCFLGNQKYFPGWRDLFANAELITCTGFLTQTIEETPYTIFSVAAASLIKTKLFLQARPTTRGNLKKLIRFYELLHQRNGQQITTKFEGGTIISEAII